MTLARRLIKVTLFGIVLVLLFHIDSAKEMRPSGKRVVKQTKPQLANPITNSSLIVPGERIGPLRLGDTQQRFWKLFQRYDPGSSEYTLKCGTDVITELHWSDIDDNGLFAYLRNGHIFEISSATRRFHTKDALTVDSTPQAVQRNYPGVEAYWLAHIRDLATGDRDFIYWVDQTYGIAFAFSYDQKLHKRQVFAIYVFEPKDRFVPLGCLSNTHDWQKIQPYSLETPQ